MHGHIQGECQNLKCSDHRVRNPDPYGLQDLTVTTQALVGSSGFPTVGNSTTGMLKVKLARVSQEEGSIGLTLLFPRPTCHACMLKEAGTPHLQLFHRLSPCMHVLRSW